MFVAAATHQFDRRERASCPVDLGGFDLISWRKCGERVGRFVFHFLRRAFSFPCDGDASFRLAGAHGREILPLLILTASLVIDRQNRLNAPDALPTIRNGKLVRRSGGTDQLRLVREFAGRLLAAQA